MEPLVLSDWIQKTTSVFSISSQEEGKMQCKQGKKSAQLPHLYHSSHCTHTAPGPTPPHVQFSGAAHGTTSSPLIGQFSVIVVRLCECRVWTWSSSQLGPRWISLYLTVHQDSGLDPRFISGRNLHNIF